MKPIVRPPSRSQIGYGTCVNEDETTSTASATSTLRTTHSLPVVSAGEARREPIHR